MTINNHILGLTAAVSFCGLTTDKEYIVWTWTRVKLTIDGVSESSVKILSTVLEILIGFHSGLCTSHL